MASRLKLAPRCIGGYSRKGWISLPITCWTNTKRQNSYLNQSKYCCAPSFVPFTGWPMNGTKDGAQQYFDWFKYEFWRFVFVQQVMGKEIQPFLEYPPMQRGASFNLDAVKAEMTKRMAEAEAAAKGPSN